MNKALLWKDYRIFRDVFTGGLALIAASFGMALLILVMNGELSWATLLGGGASLTRFAAILVGALFGGYAFAFEREERSDLFLAVLPIPRRKQLQTKFFLAVSALALYWFISMAILMVSLGFMGASAEGIWLSLRSMMDFMAATCLVFGIAWAVSASARSPLTAAFVGMMALFPVCIAQVTTTELLDLEPFYFFSAPTLAGMVLTGMGGVLLGNYHYLHNRSGAAWMGRFRSWRRRREGTAHHPAFTNGTPLMALLWKDFQLIKAPVLLGVVVVLLPHAWTLAGIFQGDFVVSPGACLLSIALCTLVFPFWAGQLMGTERATRAVEFLHVLPIGKGAARTSKFLVLLVGPVVLTALDVALLLYANNSGGAVPFNGHLTWAQWQEPAEVITGLALSNGALVALGVAWLLAARGDRTLMAIILGILASPVMVVLWASLSTWSSEIGSGMLTPRNFVLFFDLGVVLMVLAFVGAGSIIGSQGKIC